MSFHYSPRIVTDGLTLCLDGAASTSYPARNFVGCKTYSVYNGGLRSANYTVQYSDDNSSWTTAFSGVCSNDPYASCGIKNNTGLGDGSYGARRYWRYVEGSAIVSHHPRVSRIILTDIHGKDYNLHVYVADNCSDSGTYLVGTVSVDVAGTTWYDVSGNGYNGTITDASYEAAVGGGSFYFDGVNTDNVALPNDIGYTTAVSCFAWFKRTSNSGVAGTYHIISSSIGLEMSVNQSSSFLRNGVTVSGTRYVQNDGSAIGLDTWHYVGFTFFNYTKTAYVDGVVVGTQTCGTTGTLDYNWGGRELGRMGTSYALKGNIATYVVYNRPLSITEINKNFNAQRSRFGA